MEKNHTSVSISWERYYGLSIFAEINDLHISQNVDRILKEAGIPKINKKTFEKLYEKAHSGSLSLAEVKNQ